MSSGSTRQPWGGANEDTVPTDITAPEGLTGFVALGAPEENMMHPRCQLQGLATPNTSFVMNGAMGEKTNLGRKLCSQSIQFMYRHDPGLSTGRR